MSAILNDPPFFGGLVNINIKANKDTPLNLGQGSGPSPPAPPSAAPVLELFDVSTIELVFSFNTSSITGTQPIFYQIIYGESLPLTEYAIPVEIGQDLYEVVVTNLKPETTYLFQTIATNIDGSVESIVVDYSTNPDTTLPPSKAPTLPTLVDAGRNTMYLTFDVAGIEGTQPIEYSMEYGLTAGLGLSVPAILVSGTTYSALADNLTAQTDYYFASVASNINGGKISLTVGPYTTLA